MNEFWGAASSFRRQFSSFLLTNMKTFLLAALTLSTTGALACDRQNALHLRDSFVGMGRPERAAFRWFPNTQTMPDQMRAHLMESYATADGCLNGKPRLIDFYVGTKLIGQVGADGFFMPTDPAYDLPVRPGVHFWLKAHVK